MISAPALLKRHGLAAKKSWGQCFLVDEATFTAIVHAAGAGPGERVIEIGAGLGTLTQRLAATGAEVIAIERDRDLVAVLHAELGGDPRITIIADNALTVDYGALGAGARPALAVGNLPYQIAAPILFRLLAADPRLGRIVIMVQKEMADRIVARPGTRAYGALSVMVRSTGEPALVRRVGRGGFHPAPRVDSAVVKIDLVPRPPAVDPARFSAVVHAAFSQRRKMLRNALQALAPGADVDRALARAGIDGARRGETLDQTEFAQLAGAWPTGGEAGHA